MSDPQRNQEPHVGETPRASVWRRPLRGRIGWLLGLATLIAVIFLLVLSFGLVLQGGHEPGRVAAVALLISVVGALTLSAGVLLVRWLSHWRNLRRALFGLACFVTLIPLAYAVENWRGRSAWLKHRAALEAQGEPMDLAALVPPPVPDDQNFAMTPLLAPALIVHHTPAGVVWADTNALARLDGIRHNLATRDKDAELLVLGSLEKNSFADLVSCAEFYRGNTNYPQATTPGAPAEDILRALSKFDPEFAELHAAATNRPASRFAIQYEHQPAWQILLPHLAKIRPLVQLAHLRAVAAMEAGRPEEAFGDLRLGLRLSDSLSNEPLLINHLVRIAALSLALQTVREGLVRHAWSDEQLAELQRHLAGLNLLAEYRLAMRGERAMSTGGLDYLRRLGFRANPQDSLPDGLGLPRSVRALVPGGWLHQNMRTVSTGIQVYLDAVDVQQRRVDADRLEEESRRIEQMRGGPYTVFARQLLPALDRAAQRSARAQTSVDQALVACAIERYRLAEGRLPAALTDLVPQFLDAIPSDVMDGQPLRYAVEPEGGYRLYSVGWNRRDDGGETVWQDRDESRSALSLGDWVWRMPVR